MMGVCQNLLIIVKQLDLVVSWGVSNLWGSLLYSVTDRPGPTARCGRPKRQRIVHQHQQLVLSIRSIAPSTSNRQQSWIHSQQKVVSNPRPVHPPQSTKHNSQLTPSSPSNPELINIHNAFHQGQYQAVLDFDTTNLSPENHLPARVLQYRAKIALGQPDQALSDIEADSDASKPDLAAVKALAQLVAGDAEGAEKSALELVEKEGEGNASVQVCGGIVLQGVGRSEEALGVLSKHQGSLEAYVIFFIPPHAPWDTC